MLPFLNFILSIVAIISAFFVISYSPINGDSAYYLSTSLLISKGAIPFKDIMMTYPPLCFYILSFIYKILGNASYETMLFFMIIIKLLCSFIIYFISNLFGNNKSTSYFLGIIYFLSTLIYEGNSILLENFVVCFQLLAVIFIHNTNKHAYWYLLAGASMALSFLCKQYGLFILPGLLGFILLSQHSIQQKIYNTFLLLFGFFVIIILFLLYYHFNAIPFDYVIFSLNGSGYGFQSLKILIIGSINIIVRNGLFLLVIPFFIYYKKEKTTTFWLVFLCLVASFAPLYFVYAPHYFLLILPYIFLLKSYLINFIKKNETNPILKISLVLTISLSFIVVVLKDINENILIINKNEKEQQLTTSKIILRHVKQTKNVMCYSQSKLNYLCNFSPLNPIHGGYMMPGFNYEINKKEFSRFISYNNYVEMAKSSDFLILIPTDYYFFQKNKILVGFTKKTTINNEIDIWENNMHLDKIKH